MYVEHQRTRTGKEQTAAFARAALLPLSELHGDVMASNMRTDHLEALLDSQATLSMASRRSYWRLTVRASAWWCRRGLTHRDVAQDVLRTRARRDDPLPWETPAGARSVGRGKTQLAHAREAGAYLSAALAQSSPAARVAAVLPLLCGLRSGEILHLRANSVDLEAGVLWIRSEDEADEGEGWSVKSKDSARQVEAPGCLRADLAALVSESKGGYLLRQAPMPGDDEPTAKARTAKPRTATWLRDVVRDVCDAARVKKDEDDPGVVIRIVTPHGLRGTNATLRRVVADQAVAQIAAALGHADRGQTAERHYTGAPGLTPALRVVGGSGKGEGGEG